MGFLSDLNLEEVEAASDDWSIPNGTYPVIISDSKIFEKDGKSSWQIVYTVDPDVEDYGKRTVSEFFSLDPTLEDRRKAWLKRRLVSLGISDEEAATMDPADVIGVEGFVTVKNRTVGEKSYCNVTKFVLGDDSDAAEDFLSNY